ncbi:MAG: hypothetical protein Q9P14_07110 [candidate division KSB1 bacterium]|nr:hypothetical protein [candidate division KSB1 bacterium]MDQ7063527.1 hypothetical protein [candidate division KSB1 bacterium]
MIDTNVFMYAAGKPHLYKQACLSILQQIKFKAIDASIDTEILQEIPNLIDSTLKQKTF